MHNRRFAFPAAIGVALGLASAPARAHDLPTNTTMNAFVRIEPGRAHLVVRVPLDLLRGVPFPTRGDQYDLVAAGPAIGVALNGLADGLPIWENGDRLVPSAVSGRLTGPADHSFESYESAVAVADRPNDPAAAIGYALGSFDAHFVYPITSPKSVFKIQTLVASDLGNIARLMVRYLPPGERGRAMIITAGSGPVALNPSWYQAGAGFVLLGIGHILTGFDHLLFLLCLVIPFLRWRQVLAVVTAFTVAHSFTLIGSAYGLAPHGGWFPPFVETAIAASIVYMACENILGANLGHRWIITGLFGLVHGFGFSYGLRENLQLAGTHLLVSLFSFNLGIEIGQIAVLAVMLPVLALLRRYVLKGRVGIVLLSAMVADIGWHWMLQRGAVLWAMDWPRPDAAAIVTLARWTAGILLAAGAVAWLARRLPRRPQRAGAS